MGKTILFSPVGGTDPISMNNYRDGSLLHISRVYKPDEVYLYMSNEILKNHEEDNRYIYCLEKLAEMQERKMAYHIIEREELKNVQEFDFFYRDFKEIIGSIRNEISADDCLLINVSSGTPAMKSGLLVLATLGEYPLQMVQVITPMKKMNEHNHNGYDVELLWELNDDNTEKFENRCVEVTCPSLSVIKQEEVIKKLITEYDYNAAITATKNLPLSTTENYLEVLEAAYSRMQLNFSKMNPLVKKYDIKGFPVKSTDTQKYFEYILSLEIKRRRGEYGDFIRAISPIILDLFVFILQHECNVNLEDLTYSFVDKGMKWDETKLRGTEVKRILDARKKDYIGKPVYSSQLIDVIRELANTNIDLVNTVSALRDIEANVRNIAAHQIVSITEDKVKKLTGYATADVVKLLHKACIYAGFKIKEEYWNAYDEMNLDILSRMQ